MPDFRNIILKIKSETARIQLLRPLGVYLLSVGFIVAMSLLSASGFPYGSQSQLLDSATYAEYGFAIQGSGFQNMWLRWDTLWYLTIATEGYSYNEGVLSLISFFPVYPLLIRLFNVVIPNVLVAAMVVSGLSYLGSLILLYRVTQIETQSPQISLRTIFMIAFFPGAIFLFAPYTESVFLLLSLLVVHEILHKRYWTAALVGAVASAVRIPGVLLFVFAQVEWYIAWRKQEASWRDLLPLFLMPSGLVMFMGYLWLEFGNPLIFIQSTSENTTDLGAGPIAAIMREGQLFLEFSPYYILGFPTGIFMLTVLLAILYPIWKHLRPSYAIYVALATLLPAWGGPIVGLTRFSVVMFPVFMMFGIWGKHKWFNLLYASISLMLLAIYVLMYTRGTFLG